MLALFDTFWLGCAEWVEMIEMHAPRLGFARALQTVDEGDKEEILPSTVDDEY